MLQITLRIDGLEPDTKKEMKMMKTDGGENFLVVFGKVYYTFM